MYGKDHAVQGCIELFSDHVQITEEKENVTEQKQDEQAEEVHQGKKA